MTPEDALNRALAEGTFTLKFETPADAHNFRTKCGRLRAKVQRANRQPDEITGTSPWDEITIHLIGEKIHLRVPKAPEIVKQE